MDIKNMYIEKTEGCPKARIEKILASLPIEIRPNMRLEVIQSYWYYGDGKRGVNRILIKPLDQSISSIKINGLSIQPQDPILFHYKRTEIEIEYNRT